MPRPTTRSLAPAMSTMDERSRYRDRVANPSRLGAHPDSSQITTRMLSAYTSSMVAMALWLYTIQAASSVRGRFGEVWRKTHCISKKRFTFRTCRGTRNIRWTDRFKADMGQFLHGRDEDPATVERMTVAACTGH